MVHLWEISSSGQHRKYFSLQGSHGAINALDFDNEGVRRQCLFLTIKYLWVFQARLLVGCSGEKAYLWSYGDYRILKDTYTGHKSLVTTCKFISGTKLATGSADRTIKVWDIQGRQCKNFLIDSISIVVYRDSKVFKLYVLDRNVMISLLLMQRERWSAVITIRKFAFGIPSVVDAVQKYNSIRLSHHYPTIMVNNRWYRIDPPMFISDKQQLLICLRNDTLKLIELRQNKTLCTFG